MTAARRFGIGAAVVAIVFGLGFGAARFSTPERVVEKEKLVYREKDDSTQHTSVKIDTTKDEQKTLAQRKRHHVERITHEVVLPDGTRQRDTKVVVDDGTQQVEKEKGHQEEHVQEQQDTQVHRNVAVSDEKSKETMYSRPSLRLSLLVGAELDLKKSLPFVVLDKTGLVYGVEVEKRLFWNVWGGAWGLKLPSTFALGVKGSMEF